MSRPSSREHVRATPAGPAGRTGDFRPDPAGGVRDTGGERMRRRTAWRWMAALLFGYVLARPVSANLVLVPVLAGMGALAVGAIVLCRRRLSPQLLPALLTTFLFALVGLAAGPTTPGFLSGVLVFVVAPLLYWLLATAVDERTLRLAFHTAAVVTVFVGATIALYVAQSSGRIPAILPSWLLEQNGAGFGQQSSAGLGGSDYTQVRFYGLSTLMATGPMWVASLFVAKDRLLPSRWLRVAAAVAATAGALSGGRRAVALVLVLTPVLVWLFKLLLTRTGGTRHPTRTSGGVVVGGMAACVALAFFPGLLSGGVIGAAWRSLAAYVTDGGVGSANTAEDSVRSFQASRLIEGWSQSPVFGHGFGATMNGYWRDLEKPWRWELQYHALLFETGVVGALIVGFGIFTTALAVVRAARARPDLVPSLVVACTGAAAMLIGNASNPYLQAPGHVWAIFLPVAVANVMLISREPQRPGVPRRWPTGRQGSAASSPTRAAGAQDSLPDAREPSEPSAT